MKKKIPKKRKKVSVGSLDFKYTPQFIIPILFAYLSFHFEEMEVPRAQGPGEFSLWETLGTPPCKKYDVRFFGIGETRFTGSAVKHSKPVWCGLGVDTDVLCTEFGNYALPVPPFLAEIDQRINHRKALVVGWKLHLDADIASVDSPPPVP